MRREINVKVIKIDNEKEEHVYLIIRKCLQHVDSSVGHTSINKNVFNGMSKRVMMMTMI